MRVSFRRMMTKMLSGPARLVLTIGSNHAPAELKSEDRQDKVDEASGGHEEKYSTQDRLSFALMSAELGKTVCYDSIRGYLAVRHPGPPVGNTGGTNISMFKRSPIDPGIKKLIR